MKKLICIFSIAMVTLTSCSNEDPYAPESTNTETTTNNGSVLKKIVANINGGTLVTTGEYIYNGNKLERIISSDQKYVTYTYTGNLITKREFYTNDILNTKEVFEYNANNQLVTFKRLKPNDKIVYRANYVYNNDGTISVTGYKGDLTDISSEIKSTKVFMLNGEVSKIETYIMVNGSKITETSTYTVDGKKTPFANILGFDKLTLYDTALNGNSHNITTIKSTSSSNTNSDTDPIEYTYNALGYPVTAAEINSSVNSGKSTIFQYFYE